MGADGEPDNSIPEVENMSADLYDPANKDNLMRDEGHRLADEQTMEDLYYKANPHKKRTMNQMRDTKN